jgi:hypothetical protein
MRVRQPLRDRGRSGRSRRARKRQRHHLGILFHLDRRNSGPSGNSCMHGTRVTSCMQLAIFANLQGTFPALKDLRGGLVPSALSNPSRSKNTPRLSLEYPCRLFSPDPSVPSRPLPNRPLRPLRPLPNRPLRPLPTPHPDPSDPSRPLTPTPPTPLRPLPTPPDTRPIRCVEQAPRPPYALASDEPAHSLSNTNV